MHIINNARAFLPFVAVIIAVFGIILTRDLWSGLWKGPAGLWAIYGIIALSSSLFFSPKPGIALYWGIAYISVFIVLACLCTKKNCEEQLLRIFSLNRFFIITITVAAAIFVIFLGAKFGWQDAFTNKIGFFNPNGIGRFAALTGLIALIYFFKTKYFTKGSLIFLFLFGLTLLLVTHARTALIAFIIAGFFILWSRNPRFAAKVLLGCIALLLVFALFFHQPLQDFVMKKNNMERFASLSGRTYTWQEIVSYVPESPLIGFGYHADRFLSGDQAHNAGIHSLIQGGIAGALFFIAGLLYALWLAWKTARQRDVSGPALEASAFVVFFAVRGLIESSGAFFGIDLLIMASCFAYLAYYNFSARKFCKSRVLTE